ncbi:hypothetical protein D6D01_08670 [Aureobasidium pullulans]|uniref:Uncharacterized protein n=1 Tax=Aureobasidium pullulans TaxID=5580 RepID=A0A4S9KBU4_AURPU|nr:hypothetical protein D6D01_08670 [Aureobasidium pullulans]
MIISTRDDLSRKVVVGRARDKTGGEENIGKRCFPSGQKSRQSRGIVCRITQTENEMHEPEDTREDEDGIMLVFGERAPIVGCPETDEYARDENEEAQGDEEG